jgi:ankyrin repeat protein
MPSSLRKALNELPSTLDDTYERALEGIPKEKRQHAHRLFQCLVAAVRPLRVEELGEIFAIEFDAEAGPILSEGWRPENPEEAVLSACSTLIAIIEDEDSKIVQFSHFSVKEFLTSGRLLTSEVGSIRHYHISLDAAHTVLTRACLTVLLQLDEKVDKKRLVTFPLALYAALHWVKHAKFENVTSRFQDAMECLFNPQNPYLVSWAWIYDEDWSSRQALIDDLPERPSSLEATALYYAALCGFNELINYLIVTHGEDVNAMCGRHGTPLHAAAYEGHLDVARLLIAHGANLNLINNWDGTALTVAYRSRRLDVIRLLLEHGADPDVRYDEHGLISHDASWEGQAEVIELLLRHNADVNARDDHTWTPLHWASARGSVEVVQLLLEHGADINAQNRHRNTPLYRALQNGRLDVVRVLLGHGADVHIRGWNSQTPFQMAKSQGYDTEIAQLLLEHGAKAE